MLALVYSEEYKLLDFGPGHPMRGDRYEKALAVFRQKGLLDSGKVTLETPREATFEELTAFHTVDYVRRLQRLSEIGSGSITPDTPVFPGIYHAGAISVGGSIRAMELVLESRYEVAGNPCGGWHHAFAETGRGFCIFNDIAIIGKLMLARGVQRIAVLDIDAHHGDGTQRAFYTTDQVLTISFHQDPRTLYPFVSGFVGEEGEGNGLGYNFNVPMPPYAGDADFIYAFDALVPPILRNYKPQVLVLQMGVDGHCSGIVSNLSYSLKSYDHASRALAELREELGFKIVFLGGGGFVHPTLGLGWGVQIANFAGVPFDADLESDARRCGKREEPSGQVKATVAKLLPRVDWLSVR